MDIYMRIACSKMLLRMKKDPEYSKALGLVNHSILTENSKVQDRNGGLYEKNIRSSVTDAAYTVYRKSG